MAYRIPGLPTPWQYFVAYTMLFMILPLVPLVLELAIAGHISEQSITLAAAMYPISIGAVSRSVALFVTALLITISFAAVFGAVMREERGKTRTREAVLRKLDAILANPDKADKTPVEGVKELSDDAIPFSRVAAFIAIGGVFLCHLLERYNYHVVDGKSPFEF